MGWVLVGGNVFGLSMLRSKYGGLFSVVLRSESFVAASVISAGAKFCGVPS